MWTGPPEETAGPGSRCADGEVGEAALRCVREDEAPEGATAATATRRRGDTGRPHGAVLPSARKSDLTVDAVKLHNDLQSGSLSIQKRPEEEEEEMAVTERSGATFLSGLSDCTNITFNKVQRFWESNSAAHKEVGDDSG
ncbi:hypothetical protein AB205_0006280, partial [Aquarana catesbeiana]